MEIQNTVHPEAGDIKALLNNLSELEDKFETKVKDFKSYGLLISDIRDRLLKLKPGSEKEYLTKQKISMEKEYQTKQEILLEAREEYNTSISLIYIKYLDLDSCKSSDFNDLKNRYKLFLTKMGGYVPSLELGFNSHGIMLPPYDQCKQFVQLPKFTNFKIRLYPIDTGYSNRRVVNLYAQVQFITDPNLMFASIQGISKRFPRNINRYVDSDRYYKPYDESIQIEVSEKSDIVNRIYLATILDNFSLLKSSLEEYEAQNSDKSVMDFIANCSLVGIAAANGCINAMRFFISLKVNLEQKFRLSIPEKFDVDTDNRPFVDPASVLANPGHKNSTLEMTPLALALSAAPAMKIEKAREMVALLLASRANYNAKVIKTWSVQHGYYGHEKTSQKSSSITLFTFDQTGLLDEAVKKIRETKVKPRQEDFNNRFQPRKVLDTADRHSKDIELQSAAMEQLKKINLSLEDEVKKLKQENTVLKKELETLKSTVPKSAIDEKKVIVIQTFFRKSLARKNYSLTDLKKERQQEVIEKSGEIIGKLAREGKFDQITKLSSAIQNKKYHEAIQLMRNISEREFDLGNGLKIRY